MKILFYALLCAEIIMSAAAFAAYGADKRRARRGDWRIPERTLLRLALLMGAPGALAAMRRFRHKTLRRKFTVSVPVFACLQITLIAFAAYRAFAQRF